MIELEFFTLDVFTSTIFGGNQLAVFPDAPALDDRTMQAIARELNLSETVFVRPTSAAGALRRLRIFTPSTELPFAGHPTIGTAQLLVELGMAPLGARAQSEFALEEGVGLVPVSVSKSQEGAYFTWLTTASLPESGPSVPHTKELAELLRIAPAEIVADDADAPRAYSAGVPFTFIPVRDRNVLQRLRLDGERWRQSLAGYWAPQIYAFCRAADGEEVDFHARMFAPAFGIAEDPATGAAAAAFAGYLWERTGRSDRWVISQGEDMGRPSELHVAVTGAGYRLETVRVGGSAVRVSQGRLSIDVEE